MFDRIKQLFESEEDREKRELNAVYQQILNLQHLYGVKLQDSSGAAKAIYYEGMKSWEIAGQVREGKLTLDLIKQDLEWRVNMKKQGIEVERPKISNLNGRPSLLLEEIKKRRAQGRITLIAVVGELGSGKSTTAIRLGWQLDPYFSIDNIIFNPFEIELFLDGNLPKAIVLDDAQVFLSQHNFKSPENRYAVTTLSKARPAKLDVLITCPYLDSIDKNLRALVNYLIEMQRGDYIGKVKSISFDPVTGKRQLEWMENLKLGLPPEELITNYEKKRKAFAGGLGFQELNESKKIKIAQKLRQRDPKYYTYRKIAELLKISEGSAHNYCNKRIVKL